MLGNGLEHLPDESCWRPICHCNHSAGATYALEFSGDKLWPRCKHRTDQANHCIKLSIFIRQGFSITFFKRYLEPFGACACLSLIEPVRGNVAPGNVGARPCCNQSKLPRTATHVQKTRSWSDTESPKKHRCVLLHEAREYVVVSG